VRAFLGLTNFYHSFVPHYADICSPLTDLTKKGREFDWNPVCQKAFDRLKALLRSDVFLAAFDWDKPCILETDASDVAYAGVISHEGPDGLLRPVIMFSHKFKDAERNWPIHDKELYAIVFAFQRYRHFLCGKFPVDVYTDHRNLAKFLSSTKLTGRLARWWVELSGNNFQIQYRTGKENVVADALSRYQGDVAAVQRGCVLPSFRFCDKAMADLRDLKFLKKIGCALPVDPEAGD